MKKITEFYSNHRTQIVLFFAVLFPLLAAYQAYTEQISVIETVKSILLFYLLCVLLATRKFITTQILNQKIPLIIKIAFVLFLITVFSRFIFANWIDTLFKWE